jgi:hypothetical protein
MLQFLYAYEKQSSYSYDPLTSSIRGLDSPMIVFGLVLLSIAFGFFGWLSGIEIGISFLRLLHPSTLTRYGLGLFRPLWLVTLGFLIVGIAGFLDFFNFDARAIYTTTRTTIIVGAVCLLVRTILAIHLFYGKPGKPGFTWQNVCFAVLSCVPPLCAGAIGVYLLTGNSFVHTSSGWLLLLSLGLGLLALAGSFVYFIIGLTPHGRTRTLSRVFDTVFCVVAALSPQRIFVSDYLHVLTLPFIIYTVLITLIILWQVGLHLIGSERYMWFYISLVALATPLLLALSNRPYLLFPTRVLEAAYHGVSPVSVVGLCALIIFGIGMTLYCLIARPSSPA